MAKAGLHIERMKRIRLNPAFNVEAEKLLKQVGSLLQAKARAEAARPYGLGTGTKSGKLVESIQIKGPYTTGSGKSQVVQVYADDKIAPHAIWQEKGTGIYGPTKDVIRPKQAQVMAWIQTGRPYVGFAISAFRRRRANSNEERWQQYAKWVKGVKPKEFIKKARTDPTIADFYAAGARSLAKNIIQVV
jgi:hypothetical protein